MTNIIEIVDKLNKEGHCISCAIIDGALFIGYKHELYDVTKLTFAEHIQLIATLLTKEFFNL